MPPNDSIAGTRLVLQFLTVEQFNLSPMRLDDSGVLKPGCYLRDGRSSHPEHPTQELMSEWNYVAPGRVTRLQKPTGQSLRDGVQGITCRSLLNLTELKFRISDDKLADP